MTTTQGGSPWADLPDEILKAIGSRVDRPVNVLTFCSVCYSWRSAVSIPDFGQLIPPLQVRLPYPTDVDGVLTPSTMYCAEFQPPIPNGDSTSHADDAAWGGGGRLIKIEESNRGKLQLLNPISNLKLRYSPIQLSLADFHVVQLSTSFRLRLRTGFTAFEVNKVILFPPSAASYSPPQQERVTVVAIFQEGRLGYWRNGDESWTLLDDKNFDYDDIGPHRGQFYVVDRLGKLSRIDSSLSFVESRSPPQIPDGGGGQKNLVDSGGDLYLVDRKWNPRAVDFKVYKLDEEMGEWVEVKSLGGDETVFVLTTECCFSAPAAQVAGGRRDCIYYSDDDDYVARVMLTTESIQVFQLEDGSIQEVKSLPRESNIFLPPGFRTEF
ncbi:unnamed protein product [Linum trigynum]|uniref:F-box domain-containing protein n=1 Tax=Linum trigynum TaxID=586398 RepID=A0AAV2EQU2_9ROSI